MDTRNWKHLNLTRFCRSVTISDGIGNIGIDSFYLLAKLVVEKRILLSFQINLFLLSMINFFFYFWIYRCCFVARCNFMKKKEKEKKWINRRKEQSRERRDVR